MDAKHGCEECQKDRGALKQIGEPERESLFGGKAWETRTHYVCKHCDAKWLHLKEGGATGKGDFWSAE